MSATPATPALLEPAPLGDEAKRALLQRRIGFLAAIFVGVGWGFYALAVILGGLIFGWHRVAPSLVEPYRLVHLAANVLATTVFVLARGRPRPVAFLRGLDLAIVVTTLTEVSTLLIVPDGRLREEVEMLLLLQMCLVSRAALVPSTPRLTLGVGAAASAVLVALTWVGHTRATTPGPFPPGLSTVVAAVWASIIVGTSTLISHVTYGLQRRLDAARVLGQYALGERIGAGGMGEVFRARHALLRRPAAIKLLSPGTTSKAALARFEREVRSTATLTHPCTVEIYDYGRTPDGVFYYAMEYLEGFDLQALVDTDGPQPPARVVHLLSQMLGALGEAHAKGLVHRDVKPANVFVSNRGGIPDFVKVLDFGLVQDLASAAKGANGANGAASAVGTPLYAPPEAARAPETADARGDLYAVGGVAYFLLTGAPPFQGGSVEALQGEHAHTAVVPPSTRAGDVPASLESLVLRCLAKAPEDRPDSATALAAELDAIARELPWTKAQAATWWSTRGQRPHTRRDDAVSPFERTIAVDPRGRT